MKFTETKPNIYKYIIDGVKFLFRIWEDEVMALHPENDANVSFRYGNDTQYRYDTIMPEAAKQDKEFFDIWIEGVSNMLVRIYNKN